MDVADSPASESVMIALLPLTSEWSRIKLPHLTLVYAGKKKDHKPTAFNELGKDASMLSMLMAPFSLRVMARERFGPDTDPVDALLLQPTPELWAARRAVEKWNASEFPFKPHVTIGPVGTIVEEVPRYIRFNRLMVGWGEENLTFRLGHDYS